MNNESLNAENIYARKYHTCMSMLAARRKNLNLAIASLGISEGDRNMMREENSFLQRFEYVMGLTPEEESQLKND